MHLIINWSKFFNSFPLKISGLIWMFYRATSNLAHTALFDRKKNKFFLNCISFIDYSRMSTEYNECSFFIYWQASAYTSKGILLRSFLTRSATPTISFGSYQSILREYRQHDWDWEGCKIANSTWSLRRVPHFRTNSTTCCNFYNWPTYIFTIFVLL